MIRRALWSFDRSGAQKVWVLGTLDRQFALHDVGRFDLSKGVVRINGVDQDRTAAAHEAHRILKHFVASRSLPHVVKSIRTKLSEATPMNFRIFAVDRHDDVVGQSRDEIQFRPRRRWGLYSKTGCAVQFEQLT